MHRQWNLRPGGLGVALLLLGGCSGSSDEAGLPGYLEADLIEVASPEGGYLAELKAARGQTVAADALLFRLKSDPVRLELAAASERRDAAEARAKDAALGEREEMIRQLEAGISADRAAFEFATKEYDRVLSLAKSRAVAQEQIDRAQSQEIQALQKLKASEEKLELAKKGQRPLQVSALNAESEAQKALEESASWRVEQLERFAPGAAVVHDTLFEPGEWVPPGRAVVLLRRLKDLRARFFVSPEVAATLKLGDEVVVRLSGDAGTETAEVTRIADQAEYTPPVIYSREQSERLVLMIEATLPEEAAVRLNPGLPVTVELKAEAP